jgi:hypothetical protein
MLLLAPKSIRPSRPGIIVHSVSRTEDHWFIEAESRARPRWPVGRIEMSQGGAHRADLDRADRLEGLQRLFARVHELFRQGWTAVDISRHLDINRRRVEK